MWITRSTQTRSKITLGKRKRCTELPGNRMQHCGLQSSRHVPLNSPTAGWTKTTYSCQVDPHQHRIQIFELNHNSTKLQCSDCSSFTDASTTSVAKPDIRTFSMFVSQHAKEGNDFQGWAIFSDVCTRLLNGENLSWMECPCTISPLKNWCHVLVLWSPPKLISPFRVAELTPTTPLKCRLWLRHRLSSGLVARLPVMRIRLFVTSNMMLVFVWARLLALACQQSMLKVQHKLRFTMQHLYGNIKNLRNECADHAAALGALGLVSNQNLSTRWARHNFDTAACLCSCNNLRYVLEKLRVIGTENNIVTSGREFVFCSSSGSLWLSRTNCITLGFALSSSSTRSLSTLLCCTSSEAMESPTSCLHCFEFCDTVHRAPLPEPSVNKQRYLTALANNLRERRQPAPHLSHMLWAQRACDNFWKTSINFSIKINTLQRLKKWRNLDKLRHKASSITAEVSLVEKMSHLQSQMHIDESMESIADSGVEEGELEKLLTSPLYAQRASGKPDAMVVGREVTAHVSFITFIRES